MMNIANQIFSWFSSENMSIKNLANNEVLQIANEMNGLFSEIQLDGKNNKISLPRIVVVGTQSSGKSTVLNNIMALDILPTGKNMVTRTPLDIRLHRCKQVDAKIEMGFYNDNGWMCEKAIKLTIPNSTKEEIETIRQYISLKTIELAGEQMNVSKTPIYLQIYSPHVPDLSLIDLPGLIMVACTDKGQPQNMPEQIEKLVESYIKDTNTIILSIIQSRSDLETDLGLAMIKKYKCNKTIGVLTKPDLMNNDSHVGNYLLGTVSKDLMLDYGYFVVKNKSNNDNEEFNINNIIDLEKKYFATHWEYAKPMYQNKIGYGALIKELTKILINAINEVLPSTLQKLAEIEVDITKKQLILGRSPPITKEAQLVELNSYVNGFNKIFNECVESSGAPINVGKEIMLLFNNFRISIGQLKPFVKGNNYSDEYFKELITGFEGYHISSYVSPVVILEKCMTDQKNKPIFLMKKPSIDCLDNISKLLTNSIHKILTSSDFEFSKYPLLGSELMRCILDNVIVPSIKQTEKQINDALQTESDYIWTDDAKFIELLTTYSNKNDLTNLREMLSAYYELIKKNIKNIVPKLIMSFVVRNIQNNLINNLSSNIVHENNVGLLKEDPKIEEQRCYCNSILTKILTIKKLVSEKIKN